MFICLEGVDGAGKTTLAQRLQRIAVEEFGWGAEIWHRGVPTRHPLEEYELDIETQYPYAASHQHLIIADRWHLGQIVYGGLYRDENLLGLGGAWHVDALLQSIGAVQLILDQDINTIRARAFEKRGEDYLKIEHVQYVRDSYRELAHRFNRSVTLTNGDLDDQDAAGVLIGAQACASLAKPLQATRTYVGPLKPNVLLLGEKRGFDPPGTWPRGAAFAPYPGTSGAWLCDILAGETMSTVTVGLANALEEDVPELERLLEHPRVVALGREASEHLDHIGVRHGCVPHPQHGRRFHFHDTEAYAAALNEAIDEQKKVSPKWL